MFFILTNIKMIEDQDFEEKIKEVTNFCMGKLVAVSMQLGYTERKLSHSFE